MLNLIVDVGLGSTVSVLDGTLDCNPPPVKYLTVKVVLDGAIP